MGTHVRLRDAARSLMIVLAISALLAPSSAFAAGYWQNPQPVPENLYDVDMASANVAWAVGQAGVIVKTLDGGRTWERQDSHIGADLQGVTFVDAANGWAVAIDGTILHTSNGGSNWYVQRQPVPSSPGIGLVDVAFSDLRNGWAVGQLMAPATASYPNGYITYALLRTSNGGTDWYRCWPLGDVPTVNGEFSAVRVLDADSALVQWTFQSWFRTDDGGVTWTSVEFPPLPGSSVPYAAVRDVCFVDQWHGWAIGGGTSNDGGVVILVTDDGGFTWDVQYNEITRDWYANEGTPYRIFFSDTQHGWAFGPGPRFFGIAATEFLCWQTSDGGAHWTMSSVAKLASAPAIGLGTGGAAFPDEQHGLIVGGKSTLSLGPDPVKQPTGDSADAAGKTDVPVMVLIAGLDSETSDSNPALWKWLREKVIADGLASDVLIAPTGKGPQPNHGIDSQGDLLTNVAELASWLSETTQTVRIGSRPVILVGHSMGGVIARGMVSDPGSLERSGIKDRLLGIVQFASPNAGSNMAHAANGDAIDPLLGAKAWFGRSQATWCLDPDYMTYFNDALVNTNGYTIDRIGGNFLPRVLDETSGATNYVLTRMHVEMGQTPNDAMVSLLSLNSVDVDFGDGYSNEVYAAHGAGVPGCRDSDLLGGAVPQVVPQTGDQKDAASYQAFVGMVRSLTLPQQWAKVGKSGSGTSKELGAPASSAGTASLAGAASGVRSLPSRLLTVEGSAPTATSLTLDAPTWISLDSTGGVPTVSVTGATMSAQYSLTRNGVNETSFLLTPLDAGPQVLSVGLADGLRGTVSLSGVAETGATLGLEASPFASVVGDKVLLKAIARTGDGSPATGANVTATAVSGVSRIALTLRDNGLPPDASAGDGVYTTWLSPSVAGDWSVYATAVGTTFERATSTQLSVGDPAWASFSGTPIQVSETTVGGTVANIGVTATLTVSVAGEYNFRFDLVDAAGTLVAQASENGALSVGRTRRTASVTGQQLQGIVSGVLTARNVRLTRSTASGELLADTAADVSLGTRTGSDFYAFGVSLVPLAKNPSPTRSVTRSGTALYTAGTIATVQYSLDGAATWLVAAPSDGSFNSASERFSCALSLDDGAYGVLVRATTSDGTVLPARLWAGDRFIVDTSAPSAVSGLSAQASGRTFSLTWTEPEHAGLNRSNLRYEVAVDGSVIGTTTMLGYQGAGLAPGLHTIDVTPVDEAGNRGAAQGVDDVLAVNSAPIAATAVESVSHDATLVVEAPGVLSGATDVDGDTLSASLVSGTAHGTVDLRGDGSFVYRPVGGYEGDDSFTYRAFDGFAYSNVATVTITVLAVQDTTAPVTSSDAQAYYATSAAVSLTATDNADGSGVAHTYYGLNGGAQVESALLYKLQRLRQQGFQFE